MAQVTSSAQDLAQKYLQVIQTTSAKWIDFDIEGAAIADKSKVDLRNKAIQIVQSQLANSGKSVRFSYTLPCAPSGLDGNGLYVIQSAAKFGAKINVVNVMAMDYGRYAAPNGATGMGDYAISAGKETWKQVKDILPGVSGVGITPMVILIFS